MHCFLVALMLILIFLLSTQTTYILLREIRDRIVLVYLVLIPVGLLVLLLYLLLLVQSTLVLTKSWDCSCRLLLKLRNSCKNLWLILIYLLGYISNLWILANVERMIMLWSEWMNSNIIGCHSSILFIHFIYIAHYLSIHFIKWSLWT